MDKTEQTILKVGDKRRHAVVPDGWVILGPDDIVPNGAKVLNLYTLQWELPDAEDYGVASMFCGDHVIKPKPSGPAAEHSFRDKVIVDFVRDFYEADRKALLAVIQKTVDALDSTIALDNGCPLPTWQKGYDAMCAERDAALASAKECGVTPTQQ